MSLDDGKPRTIQEISEVMLDQHEMTLAFLLYPVNNEPAPLAHVVARGFALMSEQMTWMAQLQAAATLEAGGYEPTTAAMSVVELGEMFP